MDRVVARATVDGDRQARIRREHPDLVVAAAAVDLDRLDVRERDDATCTGDVIVGDDERVGERRPDDDDRVVAGAAVDDHRCVLHVLVAVRARAAEQGRQVRDEVGLIRVLLQLQERVDQERVVARVTGEVQQPDVVVDLEVVVLRAAEHVERSAVAVRHVGGVCDRNTVRILERPVARVRNQRHRADDDAVVARTEVDDRGDRGVVGENVVIATEREDLEAVDAAHADHRGAVHARLDEAHGVRPGAGRVQRQRVRRVGAEEDERVGPGAAARVDDVDSCRAARNVRDHVVLGQRVERRVRVQRVRRVVEDSRAVPGRDAARRACDPDPAVAGVHDHRVVPGAAGQLRRGEDAGDRLDRRAPPVLAVTRLVHARVEHVEELRREGVLERVHAGVDRVRRGVVVSEHLARDERVAVQAHVGVLRLDEDVDRGGVAADEGVETEAAGHRVGRVAPTAVDHVVERRADQAIGAEATHLDERDEVGRVERRQRLADRRAEQARVDRVVSGARVDRQRVAVGRVPHRVRNVDLLRPRRAADRPDDLDADRGVTARERELVVERAALDRDRVARAVVRAGVDVDQLDGRVVHVADRHVVRSGPEREVELVDVVGDDATAGVRARGLADLQVVSRRLRDRDGVGGAGEGDDELVVAARATVDRRERPV